MKITVLDGYALNPGDLSWSDFESLGECVVHDRVAKEDVVAAATGADILLTNKTPLTRETIEALPNLKYIGVLATGYNVVDVDAARERGIPVANVPSYGPESVAQMAIAHVFNISRQVSHHASAVRNFRWARNKDWCFWDFPQIELVDKVFGVVGLGTIGLATAKIAQALGMRVIATRKSDTPMPEGIERVSLDRLFAESDFLSLHCPLASDNEKMVNAERLAQMKPTSFLINTSRGQLVDEDALYQALKDRQIAGAGLDVLTQEPPEADNPLFTLENCHITPHIAWATQSARARLMNTAFENLSSWQKGNTVNAVNL
ncbi:MAG: glycerate dehydrogenase [Opitutales bacterium TMED158]|nr:MAG: glycerate dehydrogenase [Opitutales bacterium TMED158]